MERGIFQHGRGKVDFSHGLIAFLAVKRSSLFLSALSYGLDAVVALVYFSFSFFLSFFPFRVWGGYIWHCMRWKEGDKPFRV